MRLGKILSTEFFQRDAITVAKELLGKLLVKKDNLSTIGGMIVETEAYLGKHDPASIAYIHRRRRLGEDLSGKAGTIFIYMVHGNWLFNILVDKEDIPAAVLVRAIEPIYGIDIMIKNRKVKKKYDLTNGPGKLTKAMGIDKRYHRYNVTDPRSPISIYEYKRISEKHIIKRNRIGVTEDLKIPLRFYIKENKWVSKK
jgi:DNA-3-methyladenine glycosylase